MTTQKEDYKLKVSITSDGSTTTDILCEVYLPKRLTDPIELSFKPPGGKKHPSYPFKFSVYGEIKDFSGNIQTIIEAEKVYFKKGGTTHWGPDISETIIVGEPADLTITNLINGDSTNKEISGVFWLTPSIMLSPVKFITPSYTGEVKVEKVRNFEFELPCGFRLFFDNHYRYIDGDGDDTISFPELVAEFKDVPSEHDINSVLQELDDLLMFTSFSARQRCVCLGWEKYDYSKIITNYRRSISIPDEKKHSFHETLIEVNDFAEFITTVFDYFTSSKRKELLRQAIFRAMREKGTIESNFLSLYSALETLVFLHRVSDETETILTQSEWKEMMKGIKIFLKKHQLLSGRKDKRKQIYEKLPELNRISFFSAFESFCNHFNVNLEDLWPVVNRNEGVSLSDIRNKLIHGDTFNRLQEKALMSAVEHLRWIVERSILAVLNWHSSKSKVCEGFLQQMTMHKVWREDRKILTESG